MYYWLGKSEALANSKTRAVQDHQRIPRGGGLGFLVPAPFSETTSCNCAAAREAAERAWAWVACRSPALPAMTRSGSECSLSSRATAGIARLLAGCEGLMLERCG